MKTESKILTAIDSLKRDVKELKAVLVRDNEVWITEPEAASLLGMSQTNLRKLRREGKITAYRVRTTGRGVQYLKSKLSEQFVNNG